MNIGNQLEKHTRKQGVHIDISTLIHTYVSEIIINTKNQVLGMISNLNKEEKQKDNKPY